MVGVNSLFSAGFNVGFANKKIDISKLKFDDQWIGKTFAGSTIENFNSSSVGYFDVQAGLNYAYFPTDNIYLHAGFSIHHLNNPKESFLNSGATAFRIPSRYIFFGDVIAKLSNSIIISPSIFFSQQAKASELVGGIQFNYNVSGDGTQQFIAGIYSRFMDAIIPMVGYQWGNFKFTFSYDVTNSSFKNFNNGMGANEFYLHYSGFYLDPSIQQISCPHF